MIIRWTAFSGFICFTAVLAYAQPAPQSTTQTGVVVCNSSAGERNSCPADTSAGILLVKSTGTAACLLGKTWGYDDTGVWVSEGCGGEFFVGPASASQVAANQTSDKHFGTYTPGAGFTVADTPRGALNLKLFSYVRYLNQKQLDGTYTDSFGNVTPVKQRQDVQVNKMLIYFLGWLGTPKFRYLAYVWTSNVSQGQLAQVVVAGNLTYTFNDHFTLGGGINALPGVRSLEGQFPYTLSVDNRTIADEFFRPSYTTGFFLKGNVVTGLEYQAMVGNNLSQLGIDAGQLDGGLNTFSGSLVWMPTTKEFGRFGQFGDYENHDRIATRFGGHYSRSDEDNQSQPNPNAFDNVQLRLSDGNPIFKPNLFAPDITITNARYQMTSFDAGIKYRGWALEGEYYKRWLNDFRGPGTESLSTINDQGYQIQVSTMIKPKTLQVYAAHSKVFGNYGDPWDARAGLNWYLWDLEGVRANFECIQLHRSPVGGLSLPYPVGGNGPSFNVNFVMNF